MDNSLLNETNYTRENPIKRKLYEIEIDVSKLRVSCNETKKSNDILKNDLTNIQKKGSDSIDILYKMTNDDITALQSELIRIRSMNNNETKFLQQQLDILDKETKATDKLYQQVDHKIEICESEIGKERKK